MMLPICERSHELTPYIMLEEERYRVFESGEDEYKIDKAPEFTAKKLGHGVIEVFQGDKSLGAYQLTA